MDLLKHEANANTTDFLGKSWSTSLISQVRSPRRITPRSKTIIVIIMSTDANGETLSGNIVTNISHHFAQFCFSLPAKQTPYISISKLNRAILSSC